MTNQLILVIDIGTTSVKSALVNNAGKLKKLSTIPYKTDYTKLGWCQQNPKDIWVATIRSIKGLLESSSKNSKNIHAIGITGHMNGCLILNAEGDPLYPIIIHSDSRSIKESEMIRKTVGEDTIYRITGNRVSEHLSLPKLIWLKNNFPLLYKRTKWVINIKDYIRFMLTANNGVTDYSDSSLFGALNLNSKNWDYELIEELGLEKDIFPQILSATTQGGILSSGVATLLNLPSGIPVSVGGGDAACATRGAGIKDDTHGYISIGSSAWVSTLIPKPLLDEKMLVQHIYDLDGKLINYCGTVQSAGIAFDWINNLLRVEQSSFNTRKFSKTNQTSGMIFLPYLAGERTPHWNAKARGAFVGLSLSTTETMMIQCVYEGVSFALKNIIDIYEKKNFIFNQIITVGGGTQNSHFLQILANCLNLQLFNPESPTHTAAIGAAMAAGVSVGIWENLLEACSTFRMRTFNIITPEDSMEHSYKKLYEIYNSLYPSLKATYNQLSNI